MSSKTLFLLAALPAVALASQNPSSTFAQINVLNVLARGEVTVRQVDDYCEVECGVGCMPSDATCCDEEIGAFCQAGWECISSTSCCPVGEICSDDATKCQDDEYKVCGDICIPNSWPCDVTDDDDDVADETDGPLFPSPTSPFEDDDFADETDGLSFPSPTSPFGDDDEDETDGLSFPSPTSPFGDDDENEDSAPTPTRRPSINDDAGDEEDDGDDGEDSEDSAAVYGIPTVMSLLLAAGVALLV